MRPRLKIFLGLLVYSSALGNPCERLLDPAKRLLDPEAWIEKCRVYKIAKKGDPFVELPSKEAATRYAYQFPALEKYGFGKVNKLDWTRVTGRMETSKLYGKFIGWERKLEDGAWARVRIDYAPSDGAHYNIEMRVLDDNGRYQSYNLSVHFECGGYACTEDQVIRMVERMN